MSTTTRGAQTSQEDAEVARPRGLPPGYTLQGWLVIILVFVAGATSLAVEMAASRLLAPYFGTDLSVWANLIGLILLYLTVGYYVGGLLVDRRPSHIALYSITAVAALLIALIPFIAAPILSWSLNTFASYPFGIFYGSLVAVMLLFALPTILLGCVSPFTIRLSMQQVGHSGRTSGMFYAISTAGSIVGTFVPVLVLMPDLGTTRTFLVAAALLLLNSLIGLFVAWRSR